MALAEVVDTASMSVTLVGTSTNGTVTSGKSRVAEAGAVEASSVV